MFFTRFCTVETGGITLFPAISFLFEMGKRKKKMETWVTKFSSLSRFNNRFHE